MISTIHQIPPVTSPKNVLKQRSEHVRSFRSGLIITHAYYARAKTKALAGDGLELSGITSLVFYHSACRR